MLNKPFVVGEVEAGSAGTVSYDSTDKLVEAAISLASKPENRKAFITHTAYNAIFKQMTWWDALNVSLNLDIKGEIWNLLIGTIKQNQGSETIVKLYKKELAKMIDENLAPQEFTYQTVKAKDFELAVKCIKEHGKLITADLEKELSGKPVELLNGYKSLARITNVTNFITTASKISDEVADLIGIVFRNYEAGYMLIWSLMDNTANTDAEYRQAVEELLVEYTDEYMNAYSQYTEEMFKKFVELGLEGAKKVISAKGVTLVTLSKKLLLEVTGSRKAADQTKDFYVCANLHCNLVQAYYSAFDAVANGDHSELACKTLYNVYVMNYQNVLNLFDAAIDLANSSNLQTIKDDKEQFEKMTFDSLSQAN